MAKRKHPKSGNSESVEDWVKRRSSPDRRRLTKLRNDTGTDQSTTSLGGTILDLWSRSCVPRGIGTMGTTSSSWSLRTLIRATHLRRFPHVGSHKDWNAARLKFVVSG